MSSQNEALFIRGLANAEGETFKEISGRIYRHLEDLAHKGVSGEDPEIMLHEIMSQIKDMRRSLDRGGLAGVVDGAFSHLLDAVKEADVDLATKLALGVREIRNIVTGRLAFDGARHSIKVVGPEEEDFPYNKRSAYYLALDLQRKHRISVQSCTKPDQLRKARAVIFEAPLSTGEIMMAGEARSLGLEMVLIGREDLLPSVPTYPDPEEAFMDLRRRIMAQSADHGVLGANEVEGLSLPAGRPEGADAAAWRLRAEILEQAYASLIRSMTFTSDRSAAQSAELDKMIREDGVPESVKVAYFQIVANGARSGETPVYAHTVNAMRHKIDVLEDLVKTLR